MTLAALATAFAVAAGTASAAPVVISFSGSPSASGPSLTFADVTVTGSDTVVNLELNGLGIADPVVDNGESITFTFAGLAQNVSARPSYISGGSRIGARRVDVFGAGGTLLGWDIHYSFDDDISAIVGGAPISYFTMTAGLQSEFRVGRLQYELAPIPLPAAAPLLLAALAGLGLLRRGGRRAA